MPKFLLYLFSIFAVSTSSLEVRAQMNVLDSLTREVLNSKEDTTRAKNLIQLAFVYRDFDPKKGFALAHEGIRLSKKNSFYIGIAHGLSIEGVLHIRIGELTLATEKLTQALRIYEVIGETSPMAGVYNNLGLVYNLQNNFIPAIDAYKKSLAIKYATMDINGIATTTGNLGVIYAKMGQYDTAIWFTEESTKYALEINNLYSAGENYQTLGTIAFLQEDYSKAWELYDRAIFIFDSIHADAPKANCLVNVAEFQNKQGQYQDAIKNGEEALSIAEAINDMNTIEFAYSVLIQSYEGVGELSKALEYSKHLSKLREERYVSEIAAKSVEIQEKYESEKKDQENIILANKNALLESKNQNKNLWIIIGFTAVAFVVSVFLIFISRNNSIKKRKQLEFEKAKLEMEQKALRAQMNPHFIFNAINSIQSYILKKSEQEAYDYLAKFSRLIRIVLNNSQEKSLMLHQELEMIKLYVEMEQLRFNNKFQFNLTLNDDVHPYEMFVPAMLIQPYIENAIWHGLMNLENERQGKLNLNLSMNDTLLKIIIEDNGIGREKSKLYKKEDHHKPFGMQLTEERLLMLNKMEEFENAKVIITDIRDEKAQACGTRVEIFIPVNV